MNIFGTKKVDPVELAKQWKRELAKEARKVDRDIDHIKHAEQKAMNECKKLAKSGHAGAIKILAKEIVNTRRAKDRMYNAKAQLNSVSMMLQTTASMIKVQGCISKSTDVMSAMNKLLKIPELRETMQGMAREMERAGLIEEIVSDAFEAVEADDLEGQADKEVERIMEEVTAGVLAPAGSTPSGRVVAKKQAGGTEAKGDVGEGDAEEEVSEEDAAALRAMQDRLQAL